MSKSKKLVKKEKVKHVSKNTQKPVLAMNALEQSKILNNFGINCQFTRDLGIELLKGTASAEQILTLKESIDGVKEFIDILNAKLKEIKNK